MYLSGRQPLGNDMKKTLLIAAALAFVSFAQAAETKAPAHAASAAAVASAPASKAAKAAAASAPASKAAAKAAASGASKAK
jgi:hypothetical protein